MSSQHITRIAFTPGEPAGIGPDLCLQLAQQDLPYQFIIIGSADLLRQRACELNLSIQIKPFNPDDEATTHQAGCLNVLNIDLAVPVTCGKTDLLNSHYVLKTLTTATQGCINMLFDAMVTGPVDKGIINDAGVAFSGHTEFIAEITGGYPVMMLATPGLRVALATTHLPLKDISAAITPECLNSVISILEHDLRKRFKIPKPKILVCGLNPHAGENGHLGMEEIEVISPVINTFKQQGYDIVGPLPADTLFTPKYLETADAVLAMYHDQGLPVLKYQGFGNAVNITLGLPIIRTSVDHGTALDLAGTGKANLGSLLFAINTALTMTSQSS